MFSLFLLLLSTHKACTLLPVENMNFTHMKTDFSSQITSVSVFTKKWKDYLPLWERVTLTVVKEIELIMPGGNQN